MKKLVLLIIMLCIFCGLAVEGMADTSASSYGN